MSIHFGTIVPPQIPLDQQLFWVQLVEKLGFDTAWWPDHILFMDESPGWDCWTIMAAAAVKTRRIRLGTAVSDPHRFHPAVFAQRAATLDQLSRGRVVLGLGSGEAMNLEPFGLPWSDRKVGRMREFIEVLRGLLDSTAPLSHSGNLYRLKNAALSVQPHQGRKIPLYLASLGPQMMELAGQWADGWMPVAIPQQFYAGYFEPIAHSARAHGRDPAAIDRCVPLAIALIEGKKPLTKAQIGRAVRPFAGVLVWPTVVRQLGLEWNPPEHLKEMSFHTVDPSDPRSLQLFHEYTQWIPDELLAEFVYAGDRDYLQEVVRKHVEAGVTHFSVHNASPDPIASMLWFAEEVMPRYSGRPAPLFLKVLRRALMPAARLGLTRKLVPQQFDIWKPLGI